MLGKTQGKRRRWKQKMGWLDSITDSRYMSMSKLYSLGDSWEIVEDRETWRVAVHGVAELDVT